MTMYEYSFLLKIFKDGYLTIIFLLKFKWLSFYLYIFRVVE